MDQTSDGARDSGVCFFHSGLAQAFSVSTDCWNCRTQYLRSGADPRSGNHFHECVWLSAPAVAHDRWRPRVGNAGGLFFAHRAAVTLAAGVSRTNLVCPGKRMVHRCGVCRFNHLVTTFPTQCFASVR